MILYVFEYQRLTRARPPCLYKSLEFNNLEQHNFNSKKPCFSPIVCYLARMSKRYFYRIEHKQQKIGPYRATIRNKKTGFHESFSFIAYHCCKRGIGTSAINCPTPAEEDIPDHKWQNDRARYGFSSKSKLRKWFGTNKKLYALMEEYDFVLRRYSVEAGVMFQSPTQCIVMVGDLTEFEELPFSFIYSTEKG